jgi:hypothetical protein
MGRTGEGRLTIVWFDGRILPKGRVLLVLLELCLFRLALVVLFLLRRQLGLALGHGDVLGVDGIFDDVGSCAGASSALRGHGGWRANVL